MKMENGSGEDCSVKVAVHARPLIGDEQIQGCKDCITVIPKKPQVSLFMFNFHLNFQCLLTLFSLAHSLTQRSTHNNFIRINLCVCFTFRCKSVPILSRSITYMEAQLLLHHLCLKNVWLRWLMACSKDIMPLFLPMVR